MPSWSRRDLLKSGLAVGAAAMVPKQAAAAGAPRQDPASRELVEVPDAPPEVIRGSTRLTRDWRFHLGPDPDGTHGVGAGATFAKQGNVYPVSNPKFDASHWQAVELPHDWAVDLPFVNDARLIDSGCKPLHREMPETSIGWYRTMFRLSNPQLPRRRLEFDGVFRDCTVTLNGHLLGRNLSGYAPFAFDITDYANADGDNVLVVRVDASEHEGWFYEGAGIYRHVRLVELAEVHTDPTAIQVTTRMNGRDAVVRIAAEITNHSSVARQVEVVAVPTPTGGRTVRGSFPPPTAVTIPPGERVTVVQVSTIENAELWSLESPTMHTAQVVIRSEGAQDAVGVPFGIRTLKFDPDEGFFLNGQRIEIKGTCNHQDHAGVGAAIPDDLHRWRIAKLKEMGCNAYRTAHNPPSPALLDACDTLGMLVVDETRAFGSSDEAMSQLERMVRRDRNHPSIIAWSILNEEPEQGTARGKKIAQSMMRAVKRLDPTRPCTAAMDQSFGDGVSQVIDIQGFNYRAEKVDAFHAQQPKTPVWGTESGSTVTTRGIYANDPARGYVSAYDVNAPWWASTAEKWYNIFAVRKWVMGGFIWTGFDYRGEPTPYQWPCISSHFGVLDTCGHPKDLWHYYKSWWSDVPHLHLFPHWNWAGREGQEIEVWCHGNVERVELFLNGRSLGVREIARRSHAMWKVRYAPGVLEARGMTAGKVVLTQRVETTGAPARVVLSCDRRALRAGAADVAVISASIVDAAGRFVATAQDAVTFEVSAEGRLLGVGNGDPSSHESDRGPARRAFNGLCAAIVQGRATEGTLIVRAQAPGLAGAEMRFALGPQSREGRA